MAIVVEHKEIGKEYLVQRSVYYISEVLIESKQRYPHWQKLVYGVFMASQKLKHYFRAIPSQWSIQLLWEILFKTEKQLAGLPSGLLSLDLTGSNTYLAHQLNPKHSWTSSMIGQSCRHQRKSQITRIGLFILMDPDSWRARGLESY